MTKAREPLLDPDAIPGRFRVMVDKDADPADWDRAVARFLLAGLADRFSVPTPTSIERVSVGVSAQEQAGHLGPIFVAGELHQPRDVVLMEEPAALFNAGNICCPRSGLATEPGFHG
jgi:hypothetical protein